MNPQEFRQEVEFDISLTIGSHVTAQWTLCGSYFSAKAQVIKINEKSFLVTLTEDVTNNRGIQYEAGHHISLPRLINLKKWSAANRAAPAKE